jgi:ABC-type phosphonate transport system ATPase subunit
VFTYLDSAQGGIKVVSKLLTAKDKLIENRLFSCLRGRDRVEVQLEPGGSLPPIADEATLGQFMCVKVLGTANLKINGTVGWHTEARQAYYIVSMANAPREVSATGLADSEDR